MSIIEAIQQRESIRNYIGEPLSKEHADAIEHYISGLKAPFGAKVRIRLIRSKSSQEPVKLGTYGVIAGASDFLALVYQEAPLAEESAAYLFEQVILFCTGLGLGTCWIGGSFKRSDFAGPMDLKAGEKLRIVSPVGYGKDKKRLLEKILRNTHKHASRKPFGTLFFDENFEKPLSEEAAGVFRNALEMVRLAPSANNSQPWRIVLDKNVLHFYHHPAIGGFSAIDLGIALCHFEQTCVELGLKGRFDFLKDIPESKNHLYSVSWLGE
jgi:nitroreductase